MQPVIPLPSKRKAVCLRMGNATDVRRSIARVANMVANGEIDSKDANAIIYAGNVVLQALRRDVYEVQMDAALREVAALKAVLDVLAT